MYCEICGKEIGLLSCKCRAERAEPSPTPESGPTEMAMCEINRLILHPNQLYVFKPHPGCKQCADYMAEFQPPAVQPRVIVDTLSTSTALLSGNYIDISAYEKAVEEKCDHAKHNHSAFIAFMCDGCRAILHETGNPAVMEAYKAEPLPTQPTGKEPQLEESLARMTRIVKLLLIGRPVRDADEAISEAERLLAAEQSAPVPSPKLDDAVNNLAAELFFDATELQTEPIRKALEAYAAQQSAELQRQLDGWKEGHRLANEQLKDEMVAGANARAERDTYKAAVNQLVEQRSGKCAS